MHNLSLVLFTIFAQAAVGMVLLLSLMPTVAPQPEGAPLRSVNAHKNFRAGSAIALALLAVGVVFSLLHLSDKLISYYSIANVESSWLSREIIMVGLFGVATLWLVASGKRVAAVVATLLGLGLVYVMAMIYQTPPIPFWHTNLTMYVFFTSALVLGAATLLAMQAMHGDLCGILATIFMVGAALRVCLGVAQLVNGFESAAELPLMYMHLAGITVAMVLVFMANRIRAGQKSPSTGAGAILLAAALVWAAEIAARIMFYSSITSLTM